MPTLTPTDALLHSRRSIRERARELHRTWLIRDQVHGDLTSRGMAELVTPERVDRAAAQVRDAAEYLGAFCDWHDLQGTEFDPRPHAPVNPAAL